MNTLTMTMIGFMAGMGFYAAHSHTPEAMDAAITAAYEMGLNECPDDSHCIADELGLMRLTVADIEEML